ncbi:MAG: GntR family transcriptional regulator [Proteobacteria bacterium]|nr:GntR family transcriptional regulator [Pseudomonadota bacterium]
MDDLKERIRSSGFKPQVLTKQVADLLADLILDGTLAPNQQLVETELQKQLGVSRSPLREAFRDLENKGLVIIVPRKGTHVRELTRKDIEENFPVRAALEGLAAREAYQKITPEGLKEMGEALEGMKQAGRAKDREKYFEEHKRFHEIFIASSGNELLIEMLNTLRMHRLWYLITYRYQMLNIDRAVKVHQKIYDLFANRKTDVRKLESLVRQHIEEALDRLFGMAEEKGKENHQDQT